MKAKVIETVEIIDVKCLLPVIRNGIEIGRDERLVYGLGYLQPYNHYTSHI